VQDYKSQVILYAEDLEGQIPLQQISSATKKHFKGIMSPDTVANILHSTNEEYFNQNKVRETKKKTGIRTKLINSIKSLKDDDPRLEVLFQELSEPFQKVK
jgi:hypothetical protein